MRSRLIVAGSTLSLGLAIAVLSACSSEANLICPGDESYREAVSVGPLRIPDDLSVPDETESLRIPDPSPSAAIEGSPAPECLEATPVTAGRSAPAT